ncbi:MAG: hypothetical protein ACRDZ8_18160 [Acidimicrobiales bacterium]
MRLQAAEHAGRRVEETGRSRPHGPEKPSGVPATPRKRRSRPRGPGGGVAAAAVAAERAELRSGWNPNRSIDVA